MENISEEMKMILALIDKLNLKILATGGDCTNAPIDSSLFGRAPIEYTYTVVPKQQGD